MNYSKSQKDLFFPRNNKTIKIMLRCRHLDSTGWEYYSGRN